MKILLRSCIVFLMTIIPAYTEGITGVDISAPGSTNKPTPSIIKDSLTREIVSVSKESGDSSKPKNIAVLTLKNSEGVSVGDAELITDRLNIELFKTKQVTLLERGQIKEILAEQNFQFSGSCNDEKCLVEMGQILGVQEIITGSLGRLGALIIINLRSIDVTTGKIVNVVSQDISGSLEDVITYLPDIARKLAGLDIIVKTPRGKTSITQVLKPTKNSGMVIIRSFPAGAEIYLNDMKMGVTPFIDNTLIPDRYFLKLVLNRYEPYTETFELQPGAIKEISQTLLYNYGSIVVLTQPQGAAVSINSNPVGITPYINDSIEPGEHKISLSMKGFQDVTDKFQSVRNKRDTLTYTLFSLAKLDSQKMMRMKEQRKKRNARRIVFGLFAAGSWGTGIYFNAKAKNNLEEEKRLWDIYNQKPGPDNPITQEEYAKRFEAYNNAVRQSNRYMLIRNIVYGVGGGWTFFFALSIPF